jgi:EAL domain-containing protein (putative c-di-GMP-specific phosphodiesterase class I)
MEALLGRHQPRPGLLPPPEFNTLGDETRLIVPLGRWVLMEACTQARAWMARHGQEAEPFVISVNLSARQFTEPSLVDHVAEALAQTGLTPSRLRLEITETVLMRETDATVATLQRLQALGVRLAIDDFGTGYSSLSYLTRFPVDTLKIDQSFVRRLAQDPGAAAIVRAVSMLAQMLGMDVTAEGLETAEQVASIQALNCGRGQGYYFARPLPPQSAAELLRHGADAGDGFRLLLPPTGGYAPPTTTMVRHGIGAGEVAG